MFPTWAPAGGAVWEDSGTFRKWRVSEGKGLIGYSLVPALALLTAFWMPV